MWEATHKKTERLFLAEEASYEFLEPEKEEWICPRCTEQVHIKEEHIRILDSQTVKVLTHFAHNPNSTCKETYETDSHYSKKMFILSQLYSKKIPVSIGKETLVIDKESIIKLEKQIEGNRADILIQFKEFNQTFGKGIAFEIMETEEMQSINEKLVEWAIKGYSFTYFDKTEFDGYKLKADSIKIKFPYLKATVKAHEEVNKKIRASLLKLLSLNELLDLRKLYNDYNCMTCRHSEELQKYPGLFNCWFTNHFSGIRKTPPDLKDILPRKGCENFGLAEWKLRICQKEKELLKSPEEENTEKIIKQMENGW